MTREDVLEILSRLLRDILGDDSIVLQEATTRRQIPRWDSFAYINFIIATEGEFQVKFKLSDIEAFATVGDIISAVKDARA